MKKILMATAIAVWCLLFGRYLLGEPAMTRHGMDYYHIIKYQMENLMRGVIPLWDPFLFWGRPDNIDVRFIGEFNPFLWLYPFFSGLGLPPSLAFLYYSLIYHWVGLIGFYLLARRIFQDTFLAVTAFVLLMFSSLVFNVFNNYCVTLLFVPLVWFFYFLVAFNQKPKKHFFVGLIFSTMILMTTYLPFYFLIILGAFLIFFVMLYPQEAKAKIFQGGRFLKEHKILTVVSALALILSVIPGWLWFVTSEGGEYILSWRHEGSENPNAASMVYSTVSATGIVGPMTFRGLFADLDSPRGLLFFVPIFAYLMIPLSAVNKINKRSVVLFATGFLIFLITLTDLTPVHRFFYERIYAFQLFRNIFYLGTLGLLPLFILFAVEQLRILLAVGEKRGNKFLRMGWVALAHIIFFIFLYRMGDIIVSSYVTVGLSLTFFLCYMSGWLRMRKNLFYFLLTLTILIQPGEVFYHSIRKGIDVVDWFPKDRFQPKFYFERPSRKSESVYLDYHKGRGPEILQDASGFEEWKYTGLHRSYLLHENIDHEILESYVHHKFVLYDRVEIVDTEQFDFARLQDTLAKKENLAFILEDHLNQPRQMSVSPAAPHFKILSGNSEEFQLVEFDLNTIKFKTNFRNSQFLVYNDGYDQNWRGYLDGQRTTLERANFAFKGLWIPSGEHIVELRYGPVWLFAVNYFLLFLFAAMFAYLLYLSFRLKIKNFLSARFRS